MDGGAGLGGDEGDGLGVARDGLLVLGGKKTLLVQLVLQLFEGHVQFPHPVRSQGVHVQLVLPVPWEGGDAAVGDDLHAALRLEPQAGGRGAEEDAAEGSAGVLEGEIVVAGGVFFVVGDLPPDVDAGEVPVTVQDALDIGVHLGDRIDGF